MTFMKQNLSFQCAAYNKEFYFIVAKCHTSLQKTCGWGELLLVFVINKDKKSYTVIGNSKNIIIKVVIT